MAGWEWVIGRRGLGVSLSFPLWAFSDCCGASVVAVA